MNEESREKLIEKLNRMLLPQCSGSEQLTLANEALALLKPKCATCGGRGYVFRKGPYSDINHEPCPDCPPEQPSKDKCENCEENPSLGGRCFVDSKFVCIHKADKPEQPKPKFDWLCKKCGREFVDGDEQEICGSEITSYQCPNRECNADSKDWEHLGCEKEQPSEELVDMPVRWIGKIYNACTDPCDMLYGPCACGAFHLSLIHI